MKIYNLETRKFMSKFQNKTLPTPFRNYFTPASNFYNYRTKREIQKKEDNIYPKSTKNLIQRLIRICGTNS